MAAKIEINGNRLTVGPPTELFEDVETRYGLRSFDVAPDGRFLVIKEEGNAITAANEQHSATRIRIVQNWFEELRRLVPAGE